jgi:hypothetical protein
MATPTSRRVI